MTAKVEVSFTWRGRALTIRAAMAPAEPDVGIMSPYPDGITVLDEAGKTIEMSDDELDELCEADELQDRLVEAYYA